MKVYDNKKDRNVYIVLKTNGFSLINPDDPMPLKVWRKGIKHYHFDGWESKEGTNQMADKPKYLTLKPVK